MPAYLAGCQECRPDTYLFLLIGNVSFVYDAAGQPGTITDLNNRTTTLAYDGRGRNTSVTHGADNSSSSVAFNTAGLPQTTTDEDGVIRTYAYDAANSRLARILDMDDNYIAYSYDTQGNLIERAIYDAQGTPDEMDDVRTARKRYDYQHPTLPGMLFMEINANDSFIEYDYNPDGTLSSITDAEGNITRYTYDALNRRVTMAQTLSQPDDALTDYGYDKHGNLIAVLDAEAAQTSYVYDDMGRVVSIASPDSGAVSFTYDEAGNPATQTDARGITTSYVHDLLNRLTDIQFPDPAQDIIFSYDQGANGMGRRTGMIDPSGATSFGYDARGRLTQKTSAINGYAYGMSRGFSNASRLTSFTYPDGRTVDIARNGQGQTDSLATTYNSVTTPLISGLAYRPFGASTGMTTSSGSAVNNEYGECGCGVQIANPGAPMEMVYTYDNNKNLTGLTYTNKPWKNESYGYDTLNRLTEAETPAGSFSYTYDFVGNRLTKTENTQTTNWQYAAGANRFAATAGVNPVDYGYDANGNITAMGARTLVYNQSNRLIRVEEGATVLGEYVYNGMGQRASKTVDSQTTIFLFDFDGNIIAVGPNDGTLTYEYIYSGSTRLAMVDSATTTLYQYLNDRLGTPVALVDSGNNAVWEAVYDPFGEAAVNPNSTVTNNFRFAGQYYDEETGNHYNGARYYDPATGRYLTPDPIGLAGGINPYLYSNANPINYIDPWGLLVEIHSRSVQGTLGRGAHTYITVTNRYGRTTTYGSYRGLFGFNEARRNDPSDHGPDRLPRTSTITIEPPLGMSQDEWDNAVIRNGNNWVYTQTQKYEMSGGNSNKTGNCHTTTRGILEDAGGSVPESYDPPGANPGLHPW